MAALANLIGTLVQSVQGPGQPKCESKIGSSFYLYLLIPATLICTAFAFTGRRKKILPSVMGGRPGILMPMDAMTRHSRVSYACAFAATANVVFEIVFTGKKLVDYDSKVPFVDSLVKLLSVLIYGVAFYPLFACLAMATVLGYAVGSLYVWMLTAVVIYQLSECDMTTEERVILVFSSLPQVLCQLYLSVSIPARIPRAIREGRLYVAQTKKPDSSVDDVRRAYVGRHVTKLLKKSETDSNMVSSHSKLQIVRSLYFRTTHRWRYRWRHGFRYPTRFLSVMFVSMVVVYATTVAIFARIIGIDSSIDEYQGQGNAAVVTVLKVERTSAIINLLVAFFMSFVTNVVTALCVPHYGGQEAPILYG